MYRSLYTSLCGSNVVYMFVSIKFLVAFDATYFKICIYRWLRIDFKPIFVPKIAIRMDLRIKEIIKEKRITIQDLADVIGINRVTLSNSINGNPTVETLQKIATALNVEIWELFTSSTNTNELTALIDYKGVLYRFDNIESLKEFVKDLE